MRRAIKSGAEQGELEVETIERQSQRSEAVGANEIAISRLLVWPIVALLITGGWHFTVEAIWPDLRTFFVPPVLAPVLFAYGAWVGYRGATARGSVAVAGL